MFVTDGNNATQDKTDGAAVHMLNFDEMRDKVNTDTPHFFSSYNHLYEYNLVCVVKNITDGTLKRSLLVLV